MNYKLDQELFAVVCDLQTELLTALGALVVAADNVIGKYQREVCRNISDSVAGYITLRKDTKTVASRILVRPIVEATFRIAAVGKVPETLYQIAHSEWDEDRKFLTAAKENGNNVDLDGWERRRDEMRARFKKFFSGKVLKEEFVNSYQLAEIGGWKKVYAFQYRLYCNFTHASLRTGLAWGDTMPFLDHVTVASCTLAAIEVVHSLGGATPNRARLVARLQTLIPQAGIDESKA